MDIITVLPVSGNRFAYQASILCELSKATDGYPTLYLASSGGNVATYCCMAGDWSDYSLQRILCSISSDKLLSRWTGSMAPVIPSWVLGVFKGSMYDRAKCDDLLASFFTQDTVQKSEIWTSTFNKATGKTHLFCNRSSSMLDVGLLKVDKYCCSPPTFLGGVLPRIECVIRASASIPVFIPPVDIDGCPHIDGGMSYASPMTPMQDVFVPKEKLHINYISGFDVEKTAFTSTGGNIFKNWENTISEIVRASCLNDRTVGVNLISSHPCHDRCMHGRTVKGDSTFYSGQCTQEVLTKIQAYRSRFSKSLLELYCPLQEEPFSLTSFTGQDVVEAFSTCKDNYCFRLWVSCPNEVLSSPIESFWDSYESQPLPQKKLWFLH